MEHYLTDIEIKQLRHLSNINIVLNGQERQHLLLTGKNGSGKTTLLMAMCQYLKAINDGKLSNLKELSYFKNLVREYKEAEGEDKEDLEILLKKELKCSSSFTAFKRWLIKDNAEYYPELLQYIG